MSAQCAVSLVEDIAAPSVEVSGWDTEGQFFVEIADLDLNDSGDTGVRLCHRVPSGSLVFVRLLYGEAEDAYEKGYPTANEAHAAGPQDFTGRSLVRLIPCQPRGPRRHVTAKGQPASK